MKAQKTPTSLIVSMLEKTLMFIGSVVLATVLIRLPEVAAWGDITVASLIAIGCAVGFGALAGFAFYRRASINREIRRQTTQEFDAAMAQLADDSLLVRLGGVYALQGIAGNFEQILNAVQIRQIRQSSVDKLSDFVHSASESARLSDENRCQNAVEAEPRHTPIGADVQAAVSAIARIWVDSGGTVRANLAGAYLPHLRLVGIDEINADLSGATLVHADFALVELCGTNLAGANLHRANCATTSFESVDLTQANLTNTNLRAAELMRANLVGADLSEADVSGADFTEADLRDVKLANIVTDEKTVWPPDFVF